MLTLSLPNLDTVSDTRSYVVYALISETSGKVYVGSSSQLAKRLSSHATQTQQGVHRYFKTTDTLKVQLFGEQLNQYQAYNLEKDTISQLRKLGFDVVNTRTPGMNYFTTSLTSKGRCTRQVCLLSKDGSISAVFENATVASQELNLRAENVRAVCENKLKTTGKMYFAWLDNVITKSKVKVA